MAVSIAAIALGAGIIYFRSVSQPSYLFFFFLPVAAVAVVLGRVAGVIIALVAISVTLLPSIWLGMDSLLTLIGSDGERQAILAIWAVFLLATAYLVGWVSERGGSLSLMQGLGGRAIGAVELERRRTGQDIHDGIAQYAAAAFIETEVLAGMTAEANPELRGQVERVKLSLALLVDEARSMVGNLRPPALGPGEFDKSFSKLVQGFMDRTGILADFELEGDFSAHTDSVRICLYRTVQEALANVERHSGASAVRIWAKASRTSTDLIISDNGRGFSAGAQSLGDGAGRFGLSGMRDRAGYLGGRLTVKSAEGEGTTVLLHIPKYEGGNRAWF
jgi:signal transduction histidine kinase